MTAVRAGQLDAGSISLTALVTAVRADFDLRAVASIVETNESDNQGAFVALKESAIRDLKQLKGKRVAFYGPNTISEYWLVSALRRAGLGRNDVTYVSLPPPAQEQALRNRQIDVAWLARQFLAKANEAGGIDIVMRPIQATGQAHPSTLAFFTRKFVAAHPEAFCAWRKDYQQALDDWKRNRESRYAVLVNASYLTPMAAKAGPDGGRSDGGKVNLQDVDKTLRDMVESGFLPSAKGMAAEGLLLQGFALQR